MSEESPIEFPCDFVIKIMGAANDHFENVALGIAMRHAKKVHTDKTTKKLSKKGDYVSITLLVHFENKTQMDALYQELRDNPDVLMAL
jgi:putative lipoic acid-binding regulatory protein